LAKNSAVKALGSCWIAQSFPSALGGISMTDMKRLILQYIDVAFTCECKRLIDEQIDEYLWHIGVDLLPELAEYSWYNIWDQLDEDFT
jgi:hypothetical protein